MKDEKYNEELYKQHISKINTINKKYGTFVLLRLMRRLLSKRIDYIFMMVPVSERLFEGINLIYEEMIRQKIPYHYFVTTFLGGAMILFEKLFFDVEIRDFYRLATIYHRLINMIPLKADELINGEPFLSFSDVADMMRIAVHYKLTVVDVYKIIQKVKFNIGDINEKSHITEKDIHQLYRIYLEKKEK